MPKKTKDTKGEATGPQGKAEAKLPGSYARFKGDFSANAQIRAKAPKLLAFKTYGKLAEHIRKAFAAGQTKAQVAEGLGVTAARVNELAVCLQIEQPKARGTGDICVDRPTIGPDGEFRMEAPREPKAKAKA